MEGFQKLFHQDNATILVIGKWHMSRTVQIVCVVFAIIYPNTFGPKVAFI